MKEAKRISLSFKLVISCVIFAMLMMINTLVPKAAEGDEKKGMTVDSTYYTYVEPSPTLWNIDEEDVDSRPKQISSGSKSYTISWGQVEKATGYFVQYQKKDYYDAGKARWSDVFDCKGYRSNTFELTQIEVGKDYVARVRPYRVYNITVVDENGKPKTEKVTIVSNWTEPIVVITSPEPVEKITQTKATASSVTFQWNAAARASWYDVYMLDSRGQEVEKKTGVKSKNGKASFTLTKLDPAEAYTVRVYSVREGADYKDKSTYCEHKCYTVGSAPIDLTLAKWEKQKKATVTWDIEDDSTNISGYEIQFFNKSGKLVAKKKSKKNEYVYKTPATIANAGFSFKVRTYSENDGKKFYSAWSEQKPVVSQPKATVKVKDTKITVKWTKVAGAKSYTVYRSLFRDSGYEKVKTVKSTSAVIKAADEADAKKTYYYYVIANKAKIKVGKKNKTLSSEKATSMEIINERNGGTIYSYVNMQEE